MAALRTLDAALARLRDGLRARGLEATTDLIVVSDHGMADVPHDQVRYLDDVRPPGDYDVPWWGAFVGIVPKPGHEEAVANAFVGAHDRYTLSLIHI